MSNIRLFFSNTISANMTDRLDRSQSHYLTKVMRVKENEVFSIFNKNGEWEAKVLGILKGIVEFKTIKQLRKKESSKELWLAFSPIKSNYQNFMIQKATELGVSTRTSFRLKDSINSKAKMYLKGYYAGSLTLN